MDIRVDDMEQFVSYMITSIYCNNTKHGGETEMKQERMQSFKPINENMKCRGM